MPSWPGLSPLPRPVGLERLSVDNSLPVGAVFLRPEPSEAPPPIPFRFALWFRRGLRLRAFTVTLYTALLAVHLDLPVVVSAVVVSNCRAHSAEGQPALSSFTPCRKACVPAKELRARE